MGILDSILGSVLGKSSTQSPLVTALLGLLGNQQSGGLTGLVEQFASKGLGDIANSWVSTGKNLPISAQQVQQGLGKDTISQIASQLGISPEKASSQISQILPQVVDKLTPEGNINQADIMSKGMELLKGLMK
jgi:uncharacterized protein YidB (DUF937 family)